MTLKQLSKIEDKANEIWVISPYLHYDTSNKVFSEIVSVNLGQNTKYKYIIPANKETLKSLDIYKKLYKVSKEDIKSNFLILPENDFSPFILEIGIYNGSSESCTAFAAPNLEDGTEVIQFSSEMSIQLASKFKAIWKKYKMEQL